MKKQTHASIRAQIIRSTSYLLLLFAATALAFLATQRPARAVSRALTFSDRVAYQHAIEQVFWQNRIWPHDNAQAKPSLDQVMSESQLEQKVESYLRLSQAVEAYNHRPITAEDLQAEINRMAQHTRRPEVLHQLFDALNDDPAVIAECLARPILVQRLAAGSSAVRVAETSFTKAFVAAPTGSYSLPAIAQGTAGCVDDTWTATTTTNAPTARTAHTAVWTGTEMIVWGGSADNGSTNFNTGGSYLPSTDSWIATTVAGAPTARAGHTAVWTGTEMVVWGGGDFSTGYFVNTGGRYNPTTDSWVATSTVKAPSDRAGHTAVWTGSEMIVWGGFSYVDPPKQGGKYNPVTDTWTDVSATNQPTSRTYDTAVWTGSEMIIWGGQNASYLNSGGRYNPTSDTWVATTKTNAPQGRDYHSAVWTGSEMLVWGGEGRIKVPTIGGRYNPITDSWTAMSTVNQPIVRSVFPAVWSGSEMIIWGGTQSGVGGVLNSGGRYNPSSDSWVATSTVNAPDGRLDATGVWTGSEMIVWGGNVLGGPDYNTGGRYCAQSGSPTPTPTPTPIQLRGQGKVVGGINTARLKWQGATTSNVDIYRDGNVIVTTANDGLYDDSTGTTGQASFTYGVCDAGTSNCSNNVTVSFSP